MKNPKRVDEVVWVAVSMASGQAFITTAAWSEIAVSYKYLYEKQGPYRIARCRLTELPAKPKKRSKP